MSKRIQPPWSAPERKSGTCLKLYNSFTRQKDEFIPQNKNRVMWYSCGPTVYDASHMGHARSFMSFDILRRVLTNYFKYDVLYVMNVTDIDDKIIKRARQNHLYENYIKENHPLDQVLSHINDVLITLKDKIELTTNLDKKNMFKNMVSKVENSVNKLESAVKSSNQEDVKTMLQILLKEAKDPLSDWLDKQKGDTINEHSIFNKLSQYWENDFHKDMDTLNVLRPNVLTRVSEYVPEIIAYIEKIIENNLAYENNGSVYFDVKAFDKRDNHFYAKLVPEAYGDTSTLNEGEGDLSVTDERLSEKRSPTDFALWKSSKMGEPWWDSPWGKGRPGWHIECSVMASVICGENVDIHTGGVDLKFPHHDNELAQAEAYFDNNDWVKYFLHAGHLTISGCKMSKSLKNFITIKEALTKNTARQLRLVFLLHSWKNTLDYSETTMDMAVQYEKFLNEFFLNVKCILRKPKCNIIGTFEKWDSFEIDLNNKFYNTKDEVHNALCDNIDTRTVLDTIRELVTNCNIYMKNRESPNGSLLQDIAIYITEIFTIFGAISSHDTFGFPLDDKNQNLNVEETVMPYLNILADFREKVREHARALGAKDILRECDKLRDEVLLDVGVRLEDVGMGSRSIKLVDREELLKEREIKKRQEAERIAEKEKKIAAAAAAAAAAKEKEAQSKIPPKEMFLHMTDKYSQFDESGLPTHDATGKEITKSQLKKLEKIQRAQENKYKHTCS
ncbi:PREDICTED: cysteine--tRNA ligase, cytoplasmic [Ceratosolen solmsi marchali]|uniref:Cysteine--tRNA ligase, cytoplasmic n=1 Tax=Ceratosolen solmsi marchali TaxID=326594 RepID=A0AAJ6YCR2_9HYME|nr:PREDICTED: cysteine--tRNA ligase, cytoplasmic [Ceratosolen solmsi marchali]